jgi:hypothetical protein
MVDGVSANIGVSPTFSPGNGLSGSIGAFSTLGGTNSLVSVDALQEFRIQTSTYAPEFGRTPGGQISIATRAGTDRFHGTVFDYFRNDVLDANDWFATFAGLPKPKERQNDFGGTLGGPIMKSRTFFFFSYEGLRLRLPETALTDVPDLASRQAASAVMQPYLNAYPLPNGPQVLVSCDPSTDPNCPSTGQKPSGAAQFNSSFSNQSTLDAYSIRIDHKPSEKLTLFGRYNHSPSDLNLRGSNSSLSTVLFSRILTQTATVGTSLLITPRIANDFRINYSRNQASGDYRLDHFDGAVPLASPPFPSQFTLTDAALFVDAFSLGPNGPLIAGRNLRSIQRQVNLIDSLSLQMRSSHEVKIGVDYRRLAPSYRPLSYGQFDIFLDVPSFETGNLFSALITANRSSELLFRNLGAFVQDTWRVMPRLTLTYGLRWDVDFAPAGRNGIDIAAVTGFNNPSSLALAPAGTPPFRTPYANLAPRIGIAYALSDRQEWQTILRGGFGVFFDMATQEAGNTFSNAFPFGGSKNVPGGNFPLDSASAAPPQIDPSNLSASYLSAFDPDLKLPYTLQWNTAVDQNLGSKQAISVSYVGSVGRRLIQSDFALAPNSNLGGALLIRNAATSDYHAMQLQFRRRLLNGLQSLASYTWAHSIDSASAGSSGSLGNLGMPGANSNANRGPSDFDVRHSFSAGLTYEIPTLQRGLLSEAVTSHWSIDSVLQGRTAPPTNVVDGLFFQLQNAQVAVRPDLASGVPLYLYGSQYPGGKVINGTPGAVTGGCPGGSPSIGPFCPPPTDANGNLLRQGDLGRNALRGFGTLQWDLAVHRDFKLRESLALQFRAEMFNILNHPNFGPPVSNISDPQFGHSTQMLGRSLGGVNAGGGAFDPLYQIGGPRSIQLALKLIF